MNFEETYESINKQLLNAVKNNNLEMCKKIIYENENININILENNCKIFYTACINGNVDIAKLLLHKELNINDIFTNCTNLFNDTCLVDQSTIIEWFITEKFHITQHIDGTFLIKMCEEGCINMVKMLLDKIPNILDDSIYSFDDLFLCACGCDHINIAEWLIENKNKYNIDIDAYGVAILIEIIELNNVNIFQLLVKKISNIQIFENFDDIFSEICISCNMQIMNIFLSTFKCVDIINKCDNAIFMKTCVFSINSNKLKMLQWLLCQNPNIDIRCNNDYIFKYVCKQGRIDIAEWLVSILPNIYSFSNKKTSYTNYLSPKIKNTYNFIPHKNCENIETLDCTICLSQKSNIISNCKHQFCRCCLEEWLNLTNISCPVCRQNLDVNECYLLQNC